MWKIVLIIMCFIITGCATQNTETMSENTELIKQTELITEFVTELTTESVTEPTTESVTMQSDSAGEKETMLWYYMTTEEKWAYRFIRRYEDYGYQESLLYDIDHDGYIELILRDEVGMCWGQYQFTILDIFEDSVNFDKAFSTQPYYEPSYQRDRIYRFLSFSLYYDSTKKEYFYIGEFLLSGEKTPIQKRFVVRFEFGEEVSVDTIAYYTYVTCDKSEEETVYIINDEVFDKHVLEAGYYSKNELYQLLGVEDYLAKYELISDSIFDDSNWKPLKDRQKDLAECAKNYPVTVD